MPCVWMTMWGESGREIGGMSREVGGREVRGRECWRKMGVADGDSLR